MKSCDVKSMTPIHSLWDRCDLLKDERTCAFIQHSCMTISNRSAPLHVKKEMMTCPISSAVDDATPLDCARRVVSGYVNDSSVYKDCRSKFCTKIDALLHGYLQKYVTEP